MYSISANTIMGNRTTVSRGEVYDYLHKKKNIIAPDQIDKKIVHLNVEEMRLQTAASIALVLGVALIITAITLGIFKSNLYLLLGLFGLYFISCGSMMLKNAKNEKEDYLKGQINAEQVTDILMDVDEAAETKIAVAKSKIDAIKKQYRLDELKSLREGLSKGQYYEQV